MSVLENIRLFGQKRDVEGLQEYMRTISASQLLEALQTNITNSNFNYTWDYVLQGFTTSLDSSAKRFTVIMKIVKDLETNDYSSFHCNGIMRRICVELSKLTDSQLVNLCDYCLECLQVQKSSQMSWKELLPELLNVISEKECVEYNDEEMTGDAFKHQFINNMCMIQWFPSNITILTEMFNDMSLSKEEHQQVVNKLLKYLDKLTPQEIPPFVYQLLRLCKTNNGKYVFIKLQEYFELRYKNNLNDKDSNSGSTDFDLIEDTSNQDFIEAESTILYHIHTSASLGQDCIKDYLNFLKHLLRSPEFILNRFQLSVLLTISNIAQYEEKIFEIIKSCIARMFHEEQKRNMSAWFNGMMIAENKVEEVFSQVINDSCQGRDLVLQGLVNFAFVLLGVGTIFGRDPVAEKQWQLGNMVLFKIIKRKRHTAAVIIEQLSNRIVSENNINQYVECLYLLSKNLPFLMLENKSLIVYLMESLVQISANNAKQLLDAIIPLTKISPTIRDHFIILSRKALYSKNTETRQVAVIGFLKLLTHIKISNTTILSQDSYSGSFSSGHSLFTQISMSNSSSQSAPSAFSNEALCLEILNILKRCFMQQSEVRVQLYVGLYQAVYLNPEIGIPVLEMLWIHFRDFYKIDEDKLPPLAFEKTTVTRDVTVLLQEPLGNLILSIGLATVDALKIDNENIVAVRFLKVLDSICSRMVNCELSHFELDEDTDLSDITPEAQEKLFILKEAMLVYEALIAYKFHAWELEADNYDKQIKGLFQGYAKLSSFLKLQGKSKKGDKKKKDQNKITQSILETTIKKDGQKSLKNCKPPDTVLNFPVVIKILNLLYEPIVSWTTITQAHLLKSNKEFHQHVMQATFTLLTSIKHKKFIDVQMAKTTYGYLCDIGLIIYERIVKQLREFIDFDCCTAITAMECFLTILNIVANNFKSNFESFLKKVGGIDSSENLETCLMEFIQVYEKLFETDDEETHDDPDMKKLSLVIINSLNFFAQQSTTSKKSILSQLTEWFKNFAVNNTIKSRPVAQVFISSLLENHVKYTESLSLLENISIRIGDVTGLINEEEHNVEEFTVLNELTINSVLLSLCSTLKNILEDIEWIIARLKAEFNMLSFSIEDSQERKLENIKKRERGICCQLCLVVAILTNLSNCTVPTGNLTEAILKNIILLYNTLSSLSKHFISRSSKLNPIFQNARFDRLVRLAGKQLAPVIYKLISYIEENQKTPTQSTQKARKKSVDTSTMKNRVLKETRFIPKVVYEIEQFSKFVMQLSKKTKIDLSKFIGQGTVRDFRILHLTEVLDKSNDGRTQIVEESDTSMVEHDVTGTDNENDELSPPPSKKRKNVECSDD